jgi:hypothetical protein
MCGSMLSNNLCFGQKDVMDLTRKQHKGDSQTEIRNETFCAHVRTIALTRRYVDIRLVSSISLTSRAVGGTHVYVHTARHGGLYALAGSRGRGDCESIDDRKRHPPHEKLPVGWRPRRTSCWPRITTTTLRWTVVLPIVLPTLQRLLREKVETRLTDVKMSESRFALHGPETTF